MKKMFFALPALISMLSLQGCGTLNNALSEKTTSTEYFRVYNITTNSSVKTIADAASNGIGKDITGMQSAFPISTSGEIPDKPAYMNLVNPLQGSALAAFAGGAGNIGIKVASCDGAVWTSNARTSFDGNSAKYFALCLFPYKGGYQLDIYGDLTTKTGGLMQIDRTIVNAALGSPEEFMDKSFNDALMSIHESIPDATIQFVRGEPAPGPLPWIADTAIAK